MEDGAIRGRPRAKVNEEEVLKLAKMQCTNQEIADWFGVSKDTIERRFKDILHIGRSCGVITMKRRLFEEVEKGNLGAIVWWSKNFAGMSDKIEQKQNIVQKLEYTTEWGSLPVEKNKNEV